MCKIKKIKNKWQMNLCLVKAYEYLPPKRIFRFGIFNIHTFPQPGEMLYKDLYRGFIFEFKFRHPFTVLREYLEKKKY